MNLNSDNHFDTAISTLVSFFYDFVHFLDNLRFENVFGMFSFSFLDFLLSLLVLGAILPLVIVTVKNWSNSTVESDKASRRLGEQRAYNEIQWQKHQDQIRSERRSHK